MKHQEDDRADNVLSILSKGPWCLEVLETVAQLGAGSAADLMRLLNQKSPKAGLDQTREPPFTHDDLNRCLTLLRTANLIELTGERFAITRLGVASAARLDSKKPVPSPLQRALDEPTNLSKTSLKSLLRLVNETQAKTSGRASFSKLAFGRTHDLEPGRRVPSTEKDNDNTRAFDPTGAHSPESQVFSRNGIRHLRPIRQPKCSEKNT